MKVNIGPYVSDLIPIRRLEYKYNSWRFGTSYVDDSEYNRFDKIVVSMIELAESFVQPINACWYKIRSRKEKIKVHPYDVWNADRTLSLIILPVLIELRERKHGCPVVDDADVPEGMVSIEDRWTHVLNEMIWSFTQILDDGGSDQFYHNVDQLSMTFVPIEGTSCSSIEFNHQKDPNKEPYYVDREGLKIHDDRISKGLILFGKYFRSLWD